MAGLAMEGAVWFTTEVGMFQRVGVSFSTVGHGTGGKDCIVALVDEALVEEGGK